MNKVGFGACSDQFTFLSCNTPQFMNPPATLPAKIYPKWIYLTWSPITQNIQTGRAPITFYDLQWDGGSGQTTWTSLIPQSTGVVLAYNHTVTTPFSPSQIVYYRLRAMNGVGYGVYSTSLAVQCDGLPTFMNAPNVTSINPKWVFITWNPITDCSQSGNDCPNYYGLQFFDSITSQWSTLTNSAMGTITSFNYSVSTPFQSGQTLGFRTFANNGVGQGPYSAQVSATGDLVPQYMNPPVVAYDQINPLWIFITWEGISATWQTGGDPAIYYGIEWDQGNGTWVNLTQTTIGLSYSYNLTSTAPFPSGMLIQLRAFAQNGVGVGVYSAITQIECDRVPQFMNQPYVKVSLNYVNPTWIYVLWAAIYEPDLTGGDPVIAYGLEWDQGNGTWVNVSTQSLELSTSFNLTTLEPIASNIPLQFRTYAKNGVGYGEYSSILTITSDSVPLYMNEPIIMLQDINPTWIYATWEEISGDSQTGGDIANFYGLQWNQGNGSWIDVLSPEQGIQYGFNLTTEDPIASSIPIQFRTYATNGVGQGVFSSILTIWSDSVPLYMNIPDVDYFGNMINPTWIYLTWSGISLPSQTGGDPVNYYRLEQEKAPGQWLTLTDDLRGGLAYAFNLSQTTPFASNIQMNFRLIARNGVGFGAYSAPLALHTDSVPLRMNAPQPLDVDYNSIKLSWNPISDWEDTGGDAINYYQVQFFNMSCYLNDLDPCNMSAGVWINLTTPSVQGISLSYTQTSPTHFSRDRSFQYRVCAQNGVGMGACSPNTTVLTDTIPQKMRPPTLLEKYHDQIILQWSPVIDFDASGRTPVTQYKIQWDNYQYSSNSQQVNWITIGTVDHDPNAEALTFTHEVQPNFIQNKNATYRIRAINNVGEGEYSEPFSVSTINRWWSKARSWANKQVPAAGESFTIPKGQNWTYDLETSPLYNQIQIDGAVEFLSVAPMLSLQTNSLIIRQGQLLIGTSSQPYQGRASITISGSIDSPEFNFPTSRVSGGNKILANFGILSIYGQQRKNKTSRLLQSAMPGDKEILVEPLLLWGPGDRIGIAPSNMRYSQHDSATVISYDRVTGLLTLDRPLNYYHYGKRVSTGLEYSGIDMRTEVLLLSRNVVIQGTEEDNWGCQILTSTMLLGGSLLSGSTTLENVEITGCSQYGGSNAALRFESASQDKQSITNCSLHHGLGMAVQIKNSQNVLFKGNTIFDFGKYGINISASNSITIQENFISAISDRFINEPETSEVQPAGIMGCINSDCQKLSIVGNVVSGVSYAGFIAMTHECGQSLTQTVFRDNIAHSINGYGAVMFTNMQSKSQASYCVEASYFTAYKCSQGGVILYNATLSGTFNNMILIDNQIGGTMILVGDGVNINSTVLSLFSNSIFYGETESHDCSAPGICLPSSPDLTQCFNKQGLMVSYYATKGKPPLVSSKFNLPLHKIMSNAAYGGDTRYQNLTFVNYQSTATYCGLYQRAITLNPYGADYHPRAKFQATTFINQANDALMSLFSPPDSWISYDLCGSYECTGPYNTFLEFTETYFSGAIKPTSTNPNFQVAPYYPETVSKFANCSFVSAWNAFYCQNSNLGILLFESWDPDNSTRLVTPIIVSTLDYKIQAHINSFMLHQQEFVQSTGRLSRWPVLVQTGNKIVYDISYSQSPPHAQRFSLVTDVGTVIVKIKFPRTGAYMLIDRQGNIVTPNAWSSDIESQVPIQGKYCGENVFDGTSYTLQFFMIPGCSMWVQEMDMINSNLRLNWTLSSFYQSGGAVAFQQNLAASLYLQTSQVIVLKVKQGSVIVDFQIVPSKVQSNSNNTSGLLGIKQNLLKQIQTQQIWVGAPILNATVVGVPVTQSTTPAKTFSVPQSWNASGTEVWVNKTLANSNYPISGPYNPSASDAYSNMTLVVKDDTGISSEEGGSMMIVGVLAGVGVLVCCVGFLIYRRYKQKRPNDVPVDIEESFKEKDSKMKLQHITGSSPLKGDVTHYDEEANDEQFHPSQMFNSFYDKDFQSVRKVREADQLMADERATGDNFYKENGPQPTFAGQEKSPESDAEPEPEEDENFEKISDFGSSQGEARVGPIDQTQFFKEFGMNQQKQQEEGEAIGNFDDDDEAQDIDNIELPQEENKKQENGEQQVKIDNFQLVLEGNEDVDISRDEGRSIKFESEEEDPKSEDGEAIGNFDFEDDH